MKKKSILSALLATTAALCITCTTAFASQAVVDNYTNQYQHQSRFDNAIIVDGIDVSYYQQDVDWDKVKRHGMDYVFIRIGTTATDQFKIVKDSYFEEHYAAAKEAGLMVGVYYFSAAKTLSEAQTEAEHVITWLDGRQLDLPVVFDYEASERVVPSKIDMTSNALRFLNYIEKNSDYEAMFYSYRTLMDPAWASAEFTMNLIDKKYPVWIAQYATDINSYSRPFEFWQYADDGSVNGIEGKTDCNFWYFDSANYPVAEGKSNIDKAEAKLSTKYYTYDGKVKTPKVTLTRNGTTLTEGKHYTLSYIKNAKAGDAYVLVKGIGKYDGYKVVKFGVKIPINADNCTVASIPSQVCTGKTLKPAVKVTYNGKKLTKGKDYTVTYKNTTKVGTATAVISGTDKYRGTLKKTFTVKIGKPTNVKAALRASKLEGYDDIKVTWKKVPGASSYRVYYKKASVKTYKKYKKISSGKTTYAYIKGLSKGTKYNVKVIAYAPNGKKSSFSSVKSATTLKQVKQYKVKKSSSKKVKVSWVNIAGETGYQISRSVKKTGTNIVSTVKGTSVKSKVLTVPKKGKTYYYKVRAYKLVNGVKVCGPWSKVYSKKL